jgi:hypothetical protein
VVWERDWEMGLSWAWEMCESVGVDLARLHDLKGSPCILVTRRPSYTSKYTMLS